MIINLKCTHRRSSDHNWLQTGVHRPEESWISLPQFLASHHIGASNSCRLVTYTIISVHQGPNHNFLRSKSIWQFRSPHYWKFYRHQPLNLYFQHQLWPGLTYIWLIFNEYSTHFQLIFNLYLNTNHCQVWQSCVFSTWSTTN